MERIRLLRMKQSHSNKPLTLEELRLRAKNVSLPDFELIPESVRKAGGGYFKLQVRCIHCNETKERDLANMEKGKSTKCRCQSKAKKYADSQLAHVLGKRYQCMVQRCRRGTHKQSHDYQGRNIDVLFESSKDFIEWALAKWPEETFKKKEFDRINNDGHYSKENLQLVTSAQNKQNTRRSKSKLEN